MSAVPAEAAAVAGFGAALQSLSEMRQHEGAALGKILNSRLDEIASSCVARRRCAGAQGGSDQAARCRNRLRC